MGGCATMKIGGAKLPVVCRWGAGGRRAREFFSRTHIGECSDINGLRGNA